MYEESEYLLEQYHLYVDQNCTCASSEDDCLCLTYEQFSMRHVQELQQEWEELIGESLACR